MATLESLMRHSTEHIKTKIICTLGPASRSVEVLEALLRAGMNLARFNFSHGTHSYHQETLDNLRIASRRTGIMCATMLDTKGPEIRTGTLEHGGPVTYEAGSEVVLSTDYSLPGNSGLIACSYSMLARDVAPGSQILIADGSLTLKVLRCDESQGIVIARCLNTASIGERKNCNLPGVKVDLPTLSEKDIIDLEEWAIPNRVDFIAASFIRKASDLAIIRNVLGDSLIHIISKIENQEGLLNFDDILVASDGIMVARGDLGMEIPTEKIFLAQKALVSKCNLAGKPVVTATQMLESMVRNPRPTRAEVNDVANAVLDGSDAVMLSGETAAGLFPTDAVHVMAAICREAEASVDYDKLFRSILDLMPLPLSPMESLASSAVRTAQKVSASLIMVLTRGGNVARLVAKYRPSCPILTVAVPSLSSDSISWTCSGEAPARHALIMRGLVPLLASGSARATDSDTTEDIVKMALQHAKLSGLVSQGSFVVALHRIGTARIIKVIEVR